MAPDESTQPTILLVDDNVTNLKVTMQYLREYDFNILTARDALTGIERARLAQPDLILMDVQMPEIDGFEACRRLKADAQTSAIPIIFMTALNNIEDKLEGFAAGGVDYVPKPFQVEELLARVRAHLTLYRLQRALESEIYERRQAEAALRKANFELQRLAVLDGLTQTANRRRFDQYLHIQWEQPAAGPLSLLMCDVDCFKGYNDGYGHQAGDQCLQLVAHAISRAACHVKDLVARYGGEEFAVILPETDLPGALRVAEQIQRELNLLRLPHAHSAVAAHVTLSIGAAVVLPTPGSSAELLVAAADAALYQAKHQGRNRVSYAAQLATAS
jgi:diguanylate cyclase (GGDEF)-like protein